MNCRNMLLMIAKAVMTVLFRKTLYNGEDGASTLRGKKREIKTQYLQVAELLHQCSVELGRVIQLGNFE